MPSNDTIEIRMKLLGASQVAKEGEKAGKGVEKVGKSSERTAKKTGVLTRAYRKLGTAAKYGLLALGTAGVLALKNAVSATTDLAKTTTGLSRNLGISTQAASRWGAVAEAREIDTKQLAGVFSILSSKSVEAARKGGTLLTPFHQLGISQRELVKHGGDFNWILMRSAKALGDEAGGTKRMTAAKSLLGKGYATLLPLFSDGAKGLKEQLGWADKYGVTLDGKTNDSIMNFVSAQRESKVAMLGLKVGLVTTLMPALSDAEGVFQKFVRVLNSDLTTEQKINHVQAMFEKLEDFLIQFIADALPKVAEQGGELGVALAGAILEGFEHSGPFGKLVITAWLLHAMGGGELIHAAAGKVGKAIAAGLMKTLVPGVAAEVAAGSTLGKIMETRFKAMGVTSGRAFAVGFVAGLLLLAVYIGTEIANHLPKSTQRAIHNWAWNAGENFVNGLVDSINYGMDKANVLSFLGVDAPNIHHVDFSGQHQNGPGHVKAPAGPTGPATGAATGKHGGKKTAPGTSGPVGRRQYGAFGALRPIVIQTFLDGKVVAESTAHHAEAAAALA